MNTWIARNLVYFPVQRVRGQDPRPHLREAIRAQYLCPDELAALRDEKVRRLVAYASEAVPYYRELFGRCGIRADRIRDCRALTGVPVLTKSVILENEGRLLAAPFRSRVFPRKTGGSTGMTLHFTKDGSALAANDAVMYRCYAWYGIGIGDRQARFWGVPVTAAPRWREKVKDAIGNRIRISAFDISDSSCRTTYRRMLRFAPDYIYGYTTAIYGFSLTAKRLGFNLAALPLKAVICTAEKMYPHHRTLLEDSFSCPVVDEYGSSENGVIAFQCARGRMHMMSDHLVIEFLGRDGKPVGPGELGTIVITDLSGYAMPLIRYEIGDMGRYSDESCGCGVSLPIMEIVEGRVEDFIRTESGTLIHAAYLCYTLKDDAIREFKMRQKALNSFVIQIVRSPSFSEGTEARVERNVRSALGQAVDIKFDYVDRIEREASGKLRYFVSETNELPGPRGFSDKPA
ncbi:MAG TPA: hypothetical protein VGK32_10370 [Vicinamibacterales bacterium]|jgi:phenylacetate-CoA ligase